MNGFNGRLALLYLIRYRPFDALWLAMKWMLATAIGIWFGKFLFHGLRNGFGPIEITAERNEEDV